MAESSRAAQWLPVAGLLLIGAIWLRLYWHRLSEPILIIDDFTLVRDSATWAQTWANLLKPLNEHFCPFARLLTALLVAVSSEQTRATVFAIAGMAQFAALFPLLYLLVRRECESPLLGLMAVVLFALSPVLREVVLWYSAAQWNWAPALLLVSLLALQASAASTLPPDAALTPRPAAETARCRRRQWLLYGVSLLCSLVGPLAFSIGVLVGPLSAVYLLLSSCGFKTQLGVAGSERGDGPEASLSGPSLRSDSATRCRKSSFETASEQRHRCGWRRVGWAALLAAAPAVCMAALPREAYSHILKTTTHLGKGLLEDVNPLGAVQYTGRSVLEILLLENLGLPGVYLPDDPERFVIWLGLLSGLAIWATYRTANRRLMLWGLAAILVNYALIFPFRTWVSLPGLRVWSRYHLLPQLGLTVFLCGLLAQFGPAMWRRGRLNWRRVLGVGALAAALAILHSSELERNYRQMLLSHRPMPGQQSWP